MIDELNDHLLAAETDPHSSPAYDVRVLQCLLTTKKVPQRLSLLCMDAPEMRMQSHEDCRPVLLIRYKPTDRAVDVLRAIMQSDECTTALGNLNIHVALVGSCFDDKAVGKQIRRQSGGEDVELRIMHPTMSSSQMVVGSVFSGDEMDLIPRVIASAKEACQAAEAITAHRAVLQEDRRLKRQQEEALHLSEVEDRRKAEEKAQETTQPAENQDLEETVMDIQEVRWKRVAWFNEQGQPSKRPRQEPGGGESSDDSGTVTFRTS